MHNFFLVDFSGALLAALLFALVLYTPGAVTAWLLDLNGYRRLSLASRILTSIPLSFSLIMVLIWLCGAGSLRFAVGTLAVVNLGFVAILLYELFVARHTAGWRLRRQDLLPCAIVAVWCIVVALTLVDVQIGHHLFQSVTLRDASYRVAFIQSVIRTGTPPLNPLYSAGHATVMRNYYFWYVVCAVVVKLSALTAKQVLIASSMWASAALFCLPPLFFRGMFAVQQGLRRLTLIAFGLFAVTGLDLLVVLHRYIYGGTIDADMEWWDRDHFSSWFDPALYAPHHLAGLVCCLFGFLLLWQAAEKPWRDRGIAAALAGLAFASSSGLSIYICAAFAMTLIPWALWALWKEKQAKLVANVLLAGVVALAVAFPYLRGLERDQGQTLASAPTAAKAVAVLGEADPGHRGAAPSSSAEAAGNVARPGAVQSAHRSATAPGSAATPKNTASASTPDGSGLRDFAQTQGAMVAGAPMFHRHHKAGKGFHLPFTLQLRRLVGYRDLTDYFQSVPFLAGFVTAHYKLVQTLDWFLLVGPVYFLEFGFYCVVLWLLVARWRRRKTPLSPPTRAVLFLMTASLVVTTVVRSSVININDFGLRTALIPQLLLLLIASLFFAELGHGTPDATAHSNEAALRYGPYSREYATAPSPAVRKTLSVMVVLGFLACVFQAAEIRIYLPLVESHDFPLSTYVFVYPQMSSKLFSLRTAYMQLGQKVSKGAVLQYNPYRGENYYMWANMMAAGHQLAAAEPECGADFGGDPAKCPAILDAAVKMFAWPAPTTAELQATCKRLDIDYVVGSVEDDAWGDPDGWVWHAPLVVAQPGIRIVHCNDRTPPAPPPQQAWLR